MAETFTDKLKLSKRDTGDLNWGQGANANLEALDQHVQPALLRPPRTLGATLGSGGVGANLAGNTAYFYKVTAVNAAGETTEGKIPATVEAQVTQPAVPLPVILQWETVKGATGYTVYKATASGQEKFLASVPGESSSTYTDDGNAAVNPSISVPTSNSARTSVSRIVAGANVTVSPEDGTGEVTINASAGASVDDASETVKGITKLSVAPATPTDPVAVGDNDPRNTNPRTPTGSAGGDLSGSYPNPSVGKVNGVSVPASPSAGQVLTATGPTAAAWQNPSGGGYATVVVPAPTGIAATDTVNIQNAINSIGAGTVILREGLYVVNATIILKNRMTLRGQGKGEYGQGAPTTIKCDNSMGDVALFDDSGHYDVVLEDFSIDFNGFSRAARTGSYDLRIVGTRPRISRIALANTSGLNGPIYIAASSIYEPDSPTVEGCIFIQGKQTGGWFAYIQGKVKSCTFISNTASGGFQSSLVTFGSASTVVGCVFRHNQEYSTGVSGSTVAMNTYVSNGRSSSSITGCVFVQEGNTNTRAIQVEDSGTGSVAVTGNISATGTNVGMISVRSAGGAGKVTIIGNAGFNGYSGGSQAGNDGQTAINSGGAAGGDLSGTYPNPTAAKLQGRAVASTAPTDGQVLKWSEGSSQWQPGDAGGGGGYDTVVVAAPTGAAATDTANIQNAVNALPAGGGKVVLREGTYAVNATINLPSGKPVWIQGQGRATKIQGQSGASYVFKAPTSGNMRGIVISDLFMDSTAAGSVFLALEPASGQVFEDIAILRCHFLKTSSELYAFVGDGGTVRNVRVADNFHEDGGIGFCNRTGTGVIQRFSILGNKVVHVTPTTYYGASLALAGTAHVIQGNQFVCNCGELNGAAIRSAGGGMTDSVIQGNYVKWQQLFSHDAGQGYVRKCVISDNVNDADASLDASINLGNAEATDTVVTNNRCTMPIKLQTGSPSGGNVVDANDATIQGGGSTDDIGHVPQNLASAKGDIVVAGGAGSFSKLAVGTDGKVLKANSAAGLGVEWGDAAAGAWTSVSSQLKTTFFNSFDPVSLDFNAGRFYRVLVSVLNGGTANLGIEMLAQGNTTATDYRSQRLKADTSTVAADLLQSPRVGQIVPSDGGAILDILIGGVTSGGGFFGVGAFVKAIYFGGTDVPHFEEFKWVYNVGLGTSVSITVKAAGSAFFYNQGMLKVFRIA